MSRSILAGNRILEKFLVCIPAPLNAGRHPPLQGGASRSRGDPMPAKRTNNLLQSASGRDEKTSSRPLESQPARTLESNQFRVRLTCIAQQWLIRFHQRSIYQVLAQEPYLQFIGTQNIADHQIVRSRVAQLGGSVG